MVEGQATQVREWEWNILRHDGKVIYSGPDNGVV